MGLVYDPNEMRLLSSHIKDNVDKSKDVILPLLTASNKLLSNTGYCTQLNSSSIDNVRVLVEVNIVKLKHLLNDLFEMEKCQQRFDTLLSFTGDEYLDEDVINTCIRSYQFSIDAFESVVDSFSKLRSSSLQTNKITDVYESTINNNRNRIVYIQSKIEEQRHKLEKLHNVNAQMSEIFGKMIDKFTNLQTEVTKLFDDMKGFVDITSKSVTNASFISECNMLVSKFAKSRFNSNVLTHYANNSGKLYETISRIDQSVNGTAEVNLLDVSTYKNIFSKKTLGIFSIVGSVFDGSTTYINRKQHGYSELESFVDGTERFASNIVSGIVGSVSVFTMHKLMNEAYIIINKFKKNIIKESVVLSEESAIILENVEVGAEAGTAIGTIEPGGGNLLGAICGAVGGFVGGIFIAMTTNDKINNDYDKAVNRSDKTKVKNK